MILGIRKLRLIHLTFKDKLNLCRKILKTDAFSQDFTLKELLEEDY